MRSNLTNFCRVLLVCLPATAFADAFKLSSTMFPIRGATPVILQISGSGSAPPKEDETRYCNIANWKVLWQSDESLTPTRIDIKTIDLQFRTHHVLLHLGGDQLPPGDGRAQIWTALFNPPAGMVAVPQVFSYAPAKSNSAKSFFSPVGSTDQPDVLLSGTFLAGGNTKPIYTLHQQAGLYAPPPWNLLGFAPGLTSSVWINQNAQPPNNRTRLDPDSIQAGLSLWRVSAIQKGILYGATTQVNLLNGEFARSDPSSNITAGFLTSLVLKRKRLSDSGFATLYPAFGLEGGHNLNHPNQLQGAPVDLSRYGPIFRGVFGADSTIGIASPDRTANVFAITGSYRLRLPAMDEPFVQTRHEQTTAYLTTKARSWVEVSITYAPWKWKYLALNAKYEYGSLPPIFSLVDHQVSAGLLLQAKQRKKPSLPSQ
jgi:hypothetical protein